MPFRADRILTRLWLTVAAPLVLAGSLQLGAELGLKLHPQSKREPETGSLVMVCSARSSHEKFCRLTPEN